MSYKIEREDAERDLRALRRVVTIYTATPAAFVPVLQELIDSIEEQVKPAVEEPREFGSIVRAGRGGSDRVLWQHARQMHYWLSDTGIEDLWSELTDVEVLRVGIGEDQEFDPAAYTRGAEDFATKVSAAITALASTTPLLVEQRAYDKSLSAVAALLDES